ncbi:flagellar biosynthesis protein FlhB [Candidatus Poribacteria bacterium]|nr:flagellar biosynthesis protein FlhB [Candidatus Poribacteria bacterium]
MPEPYGGEKTEPATPRRREEVRKKGQVARSVDLTSSIMLLASMLALYFLTPTLMRELMDVTRSYLANAATTRVDVDSAPVLLIGMALQVSGFFVPFMLIILSAALVANMAQVGFSLSGYPLVPRIEKISPGAGFRRLFSARSFAELVKSIFKIAIVGLIAYFTIRREFDRLMGLMNVDVWGAWVFFGRLSFTLGMRVAIAFLVLGLADYGFQRYQFEQDIRMTKEEVRQEIKDFEGDPQIRARIRRVRRQMAISRMMAEVPRAHVVVTNPTSLAVALKYEMREMPAPVVVAKGARLMAERIREVAASNGVPIVENVPLAQMLFKSVEIGSPIPERLYRAVAEVLAYVYQIDTRSRQRWVSLGASAASGAAK